MSMQVRISKRCLTVLSAYAPALTTYGKESEFYQLLSELLSTIPKGHDLV